MIVKEILGNINDVAAPSKTIIRVNIDPDDRLKRVVRLTADDGSDFGVNLSSDTMLREGDILAETNDLIYVLHCLPQDVLLIKPDDLMTMAFAAHSIGNRHTPAVFEDGAMIVEYDYLIAQWLDEHNIAYTREERVLSTPLKHASHHH